MYVPRTAVQYSVFIRDSQERLNLRRSRVFLGIASRLTVMVEMCLSDSTFLDTTDPPPQPLRGQLALVRRLLLILQHFPHFRPLRRLRQPVLQPLQLPLLQPLVGQQLSMLQHPFVHVRFFFLPVHLPLLLLRLVSLVLSHWALRFFQQGLVSSQVTPLPRRRQSGFEQAGWEKGRSREAFPDCRHCTCRPHWQPSAARVTVVLFVCFVCGPFLLPDPLQRLPDVGPPAALPPAAPPPAASAPPSPVVARRVTTTAAGGERTQSSVVVLADATFKSLIPPSSPDRVVKGGKTRGPSQLFAVPPTLQLSGADSLYCSCQQGKLAQQKPRDPALRGTSGNPEGGDNRSSKDASGDTDGKQNSNERTQGKHRYSGGTRRTRALEDAEWCCSPDEKQDALRRVFDAPDGVAFASVGDSGQRGTQLTRIVATLGRLSSQVNLRYVNLLGDNFYPFGVYGTADPLWHDNFDEAFNHPALEKVAFFPVLGNHDYGLNPYAQIERYTQTAPVLEPENGDGARRRRLSASGLQAAARYLASADVNHFAVKQGVVGDRWRFPNYWYFTRHVFTNVPVDVENPYTVGRNIDEAYQLNNHKGKGEKGNVVVVTVYVDTMLLIADEQFDRGSPYLLSKDEIYHLQLEFIDAVLAEARRDADWIFICGHHPVVTDANMDRNIPGFAARMNELIKKYGVDVYVSGHEHMLSLFQDETGTEGTYIISGSASKRNVPVTCRRKSCLFNSAKPGFVLHLLSKTNLHHVFVDNNGEVLFTHTQHVKQRERVPEQINLLAYPPIRRVYIGPSEQSVGSARPRFAPHVYFLFGAMSAAACVLLLAVLLWLLGTFKRRKSAIVSAFMTRLQAPQTQQATSDDPKLCRDVLVVTGKVVQPRSLSDRQNNEPEHEHDRRAVQHQKLEQASAESASISRVLSKSKCSILQGTMRRSSILQPHIERKETPTSTSFEAQSLLGFSQPPRGYAGGWVRNDLPPSEKTAGRGDP